MNRRGVLLVLALWCACAWDQAFVPAPAEAADDAGPGVREASVAALGRIEPNAEEAIPTLERALRDSELPVRRRAALDLVGVSNTAHQALPDLTSDRPTPGFDQLVDEYFAAYFRHHPTAAMVAGLHQYDRLLEDYSPAAIAGETAMLQKFAVRSAELDPRTLNRGATADRELVISRILARLLELERIRSWEKNPDVYLREANYSIFLLLNRNLIGFADLRANQRRFQQTAAKINAQRTPTEVLAVMTRDHPAPDKLLEEIRHGLADLRDFISTRQILTLPSPVLPLVRETPPYKRIGSWASVDAPGPWESAAKESYYFVALPDPHWPERRVEEYLQSFSRPALVNLSIHEAYPGHYTQSLWRQRPRRRSANCSNVIQTWRAGPTTPSKCCWTKATAAPIRTCGWRSYTMPCCGTHGPSWPSNCTPAA